MTERNINFEKFLWIATFGFKTIGFDFIESNTKPNSFWIRFGSYLIRISCLFSYIFCYSHMILRFPALDFRHNMLPIMISSSCLAFAINGNIKFLGILANRGQIRKICKFLKEIYPTSAEERSQYRVEQYYYTKRDISIIITFITSCWLLIIIPITYSVVKFIYDASKMGYENSHCLYMKFYNTDYIINHRKPLNYIFIYIIEVFDCHYLIVSNMGTDLWLIPLASQLRMHLDRISEGLEGLKPSLYNSKEICSVLGKLIHRHQIILEFHFYLRKAFEISMAFNLISTVALMCTVATRLSESGLTFDFFIFFSYLSSAIMQFYILCLNGQKLSDASEKVLMAAYNSPWFDGSVEYQKMLLTLMTRASRAAQLSVLGGSPILQNTFKVVLTTSYRIFAIFNSMTE